jgi:hypothetical protein
MLGAYSYQLSRILADFFGLAEAGHVEQLNKDLSSGAGKCMWADGPLYQLLPSIFLTNRSSEER